MNNINNKVLNFQNKINILTEFILSNSKLKSYRIPLDSIILEFNIEIIPTSYEYSINEITYNNLINRLNNLFNQIVQYLKNNSKYIQLLNDRQVIRDKNNVHDMCNFENRILIDTKDLQFIDKYNNSGKIDNNNPIKIDNLKLCSCGYDISNIEVDHIDSELICPSCNKIHKYSKVTFNDNQFNIEEYNKLHNNKYSPFRHYEIWKKQIQGTEIVNIPDNIIKIIENDLIQKFKNTISINTNTNIETIRTILKNHKLTKYNNNVCKIINKITNKKIYQLTNNENEILNKYFKLSINIFNQMVNDNIIDRSNKFYIPYYIYKIIDSIFNNNQSSMNDCVQLLEYIHLQEYDTLIKLDNIWKIICNNKQMSIHYRPTLI